MLTYLALSDHEKQLSYMCWYSRVRVSLAPIAAYNTSSSLDYSPGTTVDNTRQVCEQVVRVRVYHIYIYIRHRRYEFFLFQKNFFNF